MNIGFTSTSFRQIGDLEKIVGIASSAGADCIEWGGDKHVKTLTDAGIAYDLCRDKGIKICSYGSYYRIGSHNADQFERICEIASAMDCKSVRVWLGQKGSAETSEAEYDLLLDDADRICEKSKEYRLKICPECHRKTFNDNTDAFLKFSKDLNKANFGTYFQSLYKDLAYDLDRIERTADQIESFHISFSEQSREQFPFFHPEYISKLLGKWMQIGCEANLLIEYTYIFSWLGIPSSMHRDIKRIRNLCGGTP